MDIESDARKGARDKRFSDAYYRLGASEVAPQAQVVLLFSTQIAEAIMNGESMYAVGVQVQQFQKMLEEG